MGKKPSIVEINGNRYDAVTGQLIKAAKTGSQLTQSVKKPVIDGLTRRSQTSKAQLAHKRTQRSKTLMRSIVQKPYKPKEAKPKIPTLKARTAEVNPKRLSRAMNLVKNAQVKRFGNPVGHFRPKPAATPPRSNKAFRGDIVPAKSTTSATALIFRPPSLVTSVSHQRLERMLDEALIKADAHKQALSEHLRKKHRLRRVYRYLPRWLVIALTVLVAFSAGGYFAWRNIPQASMRLASLRADIKGTLPDYVPSGFKFSGPIRYQQGAISLTFKSAGDGRSFTITQQASNWDSASLASNAIPENSKVQTSQVKGATVFIYESGDKATWVSNGIRYTIEGNAQLNSDQLLKIAESLSKNL